MRPVVEALEPRLALALITVTRLDDAVGTGDGVTLREAILAANTNVSVDGSTAGQPGGDAIFFGPDPSGPISLGVGGQLTIIEPLVINGKGASATIIDAHGSSRVFNVTNTAGDVTFVGLTITHGQTFANGGGIFFNSTGTLSILDSVVSQSSTLGGGSLGGGVYAAGSVVVTNSTLTGNDATGPGTAEGGGIYALGPVTVTGSTISGNTANSTGGDVFGGGVFSLGTINVVDSTIASNAIIANGSHVAEGGGVIGYAASVTIVNSTVSANSALASGGTAAGGGVSGFPLAVVQSTIAFNSVNGATSLGGGLFTTGGIPATIRNSIVAKNIDNDGSHPDLRIGDNSSTLAVVQASLIGNNNGTSLESSLSGGGPQDYNVVGTPGLPIDPNLVPLAVNSGRTATHALPQGSLALDRFKIEHFKALGTTPNLRAHFRFEELSSTVADNATGNAAFDGTYSGGLGLGADNTLPAGDGNTLGRMATFDGIDDQVALPAAIVPAGGFTDFSLSFWVKTTQAAAAGSQWWQGKGLVDGEVLGAVADFGTSQLNGKFVFGVGNTDTTVQSFTDINDGQWHHVVATRVSSTGAMAVYVDGVLDGTKTGPTGARTATTRLVIGSRQTNDGYFQGLMDEVAIFTRALGAGEVTSLYRAEVPPASDQRGAPFSRVSGLRDMGAYERQTLNQPLVVDTTVDEFDFDYGPGDLSLREALGLTIGSVGADTITFSPGINGQPILLTQGQLEISQSVTIQGNGSANTIIDAQQQSRVFDIRSTAGNVTIDGVSIFAGATIAESDHGGGIRSQSSGTLTIRNSTLSSNSTTGIGSMGGAVFAAGNLVIDTSTVSFNSSAGNGGGVRGSGLVTVNGSTFYKNLSGGDGGGISGLDQMIVTSSTFSQNEAAANGGGIHSIAFSGVSSSTITNNTTGGDGGGIFAATVVELLNSIVAGNHDTGDGSSPDVRSVVAIAATASLIGINGGTPLDAAPVGSPDLGHNLVGTALDPIEPGLAPLNDNGGPTRTHALLPDSPAIDAGNSFLAIDPTTQQMLLTDQRGRPFSRVFNASNPNGLAAVDMGAFELQSLNLVVTTAEDELDSLYDAADLSLREAVALANLNAEADTITFDAGLTGQSIGLTLGELVVTNSVKISGPGARQLGISGLQQSRVFRFGGEGANTYRLSGVSVRDGNGISSVDSGLGGGIRMADADDRLEIASSMIWFNSADVGGGISVAFGELEMKNVTVMENRAAQIGGVQLENVNAVLANVTVSNNAASEFVGGIGNVASVNGANSGFRLINSTVVNNNSPARGAGIDNSVAAGVTANATVAIGNSIVADNSSGNGAQFRNLGPGALILSFGNNISSDASGGLIRPGDKENTNPMIGGLGNKGGDVLTHSLLPGSPAIDAGSNALAIVPVPSGNEALTTDARGAPFSRIVNGKVDIGAYEVHPTTLVVTTSADELDPIYEASDLSLREAIELANATPGTDTIRFSSTIDGEVIELALGQLVINGSLTIQGNGVAKTLIAAVGQSSRVIDILGNSGDVTLTGVNIRNGLAAGIGRDGNGGGIRSATDGTLTIQGSTLVNNGADEAGGGIYADGPVVIEASTIWINGALGAGGGVSSAGSVTIKNSTVNGNTSQVDGGGIAAGAVIVTNSTISGNHAKGGSGGGVFGRGSVTVISSTITLNTATGDGGGLLASLFDPLTMLNSIIAGNSDAGDGSSPDFHQVFGVTTVQFNLIGDNSGTGLTASATPDFFHNIVGGAGAAKIDPKLDPLANNGGPTRTHALLADSPAIDLGNNDFAKAPGPNGIWGDGDDVPLVTDQRAVPFARIVDGPDMDTTARIDMGAYEYFVNTAPTCTIGPPQTTDDEKGLFSTTLAWVFACSANDPLQKVTASLSTDKPELFTTLPSLDGEGILSFDPAPNAHGTATITVTIIDDGGNANGGVDQFSTTRTIEVQKLHPYHNARGGPNNRFSADVTDTTGVGLPDGKIFPIDAATIINFLNTPRLNRDLPNKTAQGIALGLNSFAGTLLKENDDPLPDIYTPFIDVIADNKIKPDDAQEVINFINARQTSEGEEEIDEVGNRQLGVRTTMDAAPRELVSVGDDWLALLAADVASQPRRRV